MSKPMGPNMATATPLDLPGAPDSAEAVRRVARVRRTAIRRHYRLPEGGAPKVSAAAQVRRASSPDTRGIGPRGRGTWKDPDPRRRSSRDEEAENTFACAEMTGYATPVACPSQRLPGAMVSGAHPVL